MLERSAHVCIRLRAVLAAASGELKSAVNSSASAIAANTPRLTSYALLFKRNGITARPTYGTEAENFEMRAILAHKPIPNKLKENVLLTV